MIAILERYAYKIPMLPGLLLGAMLGLSLLFALSVGAFVINWSTIFALETSSVDWQILWDIRAPRILLAGIVGATLAVCGAALQGLFRNPLADPGLIGISSGAALAVAITIVLLPSTSGIMGLYGLSFAAFTGGILTTLVIFKLAGSDRQSVVHLILAGVAITAITSSAVGFLTYLSNDQELRALTFWTMGSFGGALWPSVLVSASLCLPVLYLLGRQAKGLNRLLLGEHEAAYLGSNVTLLKRKVILLTALAVGVSVAVSGIVGFIGLVVPHLVRLVWKADHRVLLPASAALGALLAISADTLARSIVAPSEMPVGIITSIIGGPFFLWLLSKSRSNFSN